MAVGPCSSEARKRPVSRKPLKTVSISPDMYISMTSASGGRPASRPTSNAAMRAVPRSGPTVCSMNRSSAASSLARISIAPTRRTPRASASPSMRRCARPLRSASTPTQAQKPSPATYRARAAAPAMRGATRSTSTVSGGRTRPKARPYPEPKATALPGLSAGATSSAKTAGITSSGSRTNTTSAVAATASEATSNPSSRARSAYSSSRLPIRIFTPESRRLRAAVRPRFPYPSTATASPTSASVGTSAAEYIVSGF